MMVLKILIEKLINNANYMIEDDARGIYVIEPSGSAKLRWRQAIIITKLQNSTDDSPTSE
jgi:hypothetical protein